MFISLAKIGTKRNFHEAGLPLRVVFSDGSVVSNRLARGEDGKPVTVTFRHPRAERLFVTQGGIGFVEAFHQQLLDISDDDFERLIDHCRGVYVGVRSPWLVRLRRIFHARSVSNRDWAQAKRNAAFHYDYPARFFELILGSTYGYVEGYWRTGHETLDEAMDARFAYMCRKLYLKPGMHVVEVGSGWGYMTNLMARDHGVSVDTFGLVGTQNAALLSRARDWGVEDRITLLEEDHRALAQRPGRYDRYVSLGVLEHAGRGCDADWIDSIATCLKPGGIGLLSVMTYSAPQDTDFITEKYIFPGGYIPHIARVVDLLERRGLSIIDLENARLQYGRAAKEWLANFKRNWPEIQAIDPDVFDERFRRTWFVYLMGAATAFVSPGSNLSVQQIVFSKGRDHDYPLTRDFLYAAKDSD